MNIGETVEQEKTLCDEGDKVSAGGGCEAAVTVRTRCGWVRFMECGELLYGRKFHALNKKLTVPKEYLSLAQWHNHIKLQVKCCHIRITE